MKTSRLLWLGAAAWVGTAFLVNPHDAVLACGFGGAITAGIALLAMERGQ